jgi:hypothetical protein
MRSEIIGPVIIGGKRTNLGSLRYKAHWWKGNEENATKVFQRRVICDKAGPVLTKEWEC